MPFLPFYEAAQLVPSLKACDVRSVRLLRSDKNYVMPRLCELPDYVERERG